MFDCGHIFCLKCLQDFYNDAIQEGSLSVVRCLTPNCAKERAADAPSSKPQRAFFISPSELLQIGLPEETVKRYVTLKYKTELEADKDTVYCPRQWCSGAARSKKRKKPLGLEFSESTVLETPAEEHQTTPGRPKFDRGDLLCVCEDCGFAFCSRCLQTWHGEFVSCVPKRGNGELTDEEKASLEYLKLHTSPCPTCAAPAQKTHGCNHMICSRCDTHFCYLCSSWLDPANPYKHYNQQAGGKLTSCYMRLWELEGGDGDDVGIGFVGGAGRDNVDVELVDDDGDIEGDIEVVGLVPEVEEADDMANNNAHGRHQGELVARVAREAPLVLRLDNPPRRPPQPAHQPQPQRGRGRGGRGRVRQQQQQQEPARVAARIRARGRRGENVQVRAEANNGAALGPEQEAWVRRFVQMALMDEEDQVGGDSDSDDGNWQIR